MAENILCYDLQEYYLLVEEYINFLEELQNKMQIKKIFYIKQ